MNLPSYELRTELRLRGTHKGLYRVLGGTYLGIYCKFLIQGSYVYRVINMVSQI